MLIDDNYFTKFINSFVKDGKAGKDTVNLINLILPSLKNEDCKHQIINQRFSKHLASLYSICSNAKATNLFEEINKNELYKLKKLLDKGIEYFNQSTDLDMIEQYRAIQEH